MGRASRKGVGGAVLRDNREPASLEGKEVLSGWGWQDKEITPGKIDNVARSAYLFGQCAYLALALHEETGGAIWAIVDAEENPDEVFDPREHVPDHFGVEVGGQIVDINGGQDWDEWEAAHGGYAVLVRPEDVCEWQKFHQASGQWREAKTDEEQMALARTFVGPVLDGIR